MELDILLEEFSFDYGYLLYPKRKALYVCRMALVEFHKWLLFSQAVLTKFHVHSTNFFRDHTALSWLLTMECSFFRQYRSSVCFEKDRFIWSWRIDLIQIATRFWLLVRYSTMVVTCLFLKHGGLQIPRHANRNTFHYYITPIFL